MSYREDVKNVTELLNNIEAAISDNLNTVVLDLVTLVAQKQINELYIPESRSENETQIYPVIEMNSVTHDGKNKKLFLVLGSYNENIESLIDQAQVNDSTREILLNTHQYLSHINQYHVNALEYNEVSSRLNLNNKLEDIVYPSFVYPDFKEQCKQLLTEKASKKLSFK